MIAFALLLAASPSVADQTDENHLIIPGKAIGPIKVGMSVDAVTSAIGSSPGRLVPLSLPGPLNVNVGFWPTAAGRGAFIVSFTKDRMRLSLEEQSSLGLIRNQVI